ncbi:MAG: hypothetical protein MUC35_01910 [Candidatus Margulisbacteria bacterium]|jgi:hypothetical protein|nr:hypothetical protein [Candidatus Margulisiibacteriota bacterium]
MMKKGNILPLTFILISALAAIVFSYSYLTVTSLKNSGRAVSQAQALCLAEAGLAKATWYLMTPVVSGGKGITWRTPGTTESFAGGSYTLRINDPSSGNILITAEGTVGSVNRVIQAEYNQYPAAVKYGIFGSNYLGIGDRTRVRGDIYNNGDVQIDPGAIVSGEVVVTPGHSISGGGTWTPGSLPADPPAFPWLDTTYYDAEIAAAAAQNLNINKYYYGTVNLAGGKLYDKNNMTIYGTIVGPGVIAAAYDLTIKFGATIDQRVTLIAGRNLKFENSISLGGDSTMFGRTSISFFDNIAIANRVSLLSPNLVSIGNWQTINGIIYGGQVSIGNHSVVRGNLIGGATGAVSLGDDSYFSFDPIRRPSTPPPGLDTSFSFRNGSWKEL